MILPGRQQGFVRLLAQFVAGMILLALAARFAWWAGTEENFDQVATILWAAGFVIAYYITLENSFILRVPAGFGVFALIGLASLPLSWLGGSRIALLALLTAQLAFSFHAGRAVSDRLRTRRSGADEREAAREGGDLVAGLWRWGLLALAAFMVFLVVPLLAMLFVSLIVDLSPQAMKWLAAVWGVAGVAWYGYRRGAARWLRVPACVWVFLVVTAAILVADAIAGPFSESSGVQVAYTAMPGAVVAGYIEVFLLGGGRLDGDG